MKVLLTGATGFLGQHIISRLLEQGCEITAIVRPTSETGHLPSGRLRLLYGDLQDEQLIREGLKGVNAVVHAATSKGKSRQDFYQVNVRSTELLLKNSPRDSLKRFIFVSSVIVYDHSSAGDGTIFREESPIERKIFTEYSRSKIAAEKIVQMYHRAHGIPTVVIRPAGLYGPGGLLYPARLGFSVGVDRYLVVGNGKRPLPLSHVRSVSDAVWRCMVTDSCAGRSYNIVEDDPVTQMDFLNIVKEVYNPRLSVVRVPAPVFRTMEFITRKMLGLAGMKSPVRPLYSRLCSSSFYYSNERAKLDLGWRPVESVQDTIREMMQWHSSRRSALRTRYIPEKIDPPPSDPPLRVGIVGCGMFSETHVSILRKLKCVEIAALCDPDAETLKHASARFKVSRTYPTLKQMLRNEKLDVVHILTPAQSHAPLSLEAMNHHCHVLVEKPMALNATEARRMIQEAEQKGVRLCVDHNHLYDEVMLKAREILSGGALGKIAHVEAWYGASYSSNPGNRYLGFNARNHWVYGLPGSLYQNMISHPLSLLLDVMESVHVLKAAAKYLKVVPHMKNDELRVLLENDRILGSLTLSLGVSPRYNFLNIYGTRATLRVDFLNKYIFMDRDTPFIPKAAGRILMGLRHGTALINSGIRNGINIARGRYSLFEGNERLIRMFYRSILTGEAPPVSSAEALKSVEVMDAIWEQLEAWPAAGPEDEAEIALPATG